jgi:hypothetical protein
MSGITAPTDWPEELSPKQKAFLEGYSRTGSVWRAADGICDRVTHYKWLRQSETYRTSFDDAKALFGERLREVAIDRALNGIDEPVIRKGAILRDENGTTITRKRFDRSLLNSLIQWASKPWDQQLRSYFSASNATQSNTSDTKISKTAKPGAPTIKGAPGELVRIGKRIGYAID